jgi:hypothetical protein
MIRRTLITLVRLTVLVGLGVGFYLQNMWVLIGVVAIGFAVHQAVLGRALKAPDAEDEYVSVNPASGLIMTRGTYVDTDGNPSGMDLRGRHNGYREGSEEAP